MTHTDRTVPPHPGAGFRGVPSPTSKPPAAGGFNPGRMAQDIRFPTADTREKNTLFKLKSEVAPAGGPPGAGHCAAATGPTVKKLAYK